MQYCNNHEVLTCENLIYKHVCTKYKKVVTSIIAMEIEPLLTLTASCFNFRVVAMVADKLKRQWL